jgi:hypothetical protein
LALRRWHSALRSGCRFSLGLDGARGVNQASHTWFA